MSSVLTFKVNPNSKFYDDYFNAKAESQKFRSIAIPFFEKYGIKGSYYQSKFLAINVDKESREKLRLHLLKSPDRQGFYHFRKNSSIEKEWENEVTSKIDFGVLEKCDFWYLTFINAGRYKMWDWNGTIYGYLENKYDNGIVPDESWMRPMKLSEYYSIIEAYEEEMKQDKDKG